MKIKEINPSRKLKHLQYIIIMIDLIIDFVYIYSSVILLTSHPLYSLILNGYT